MKAFTDHPNSIGESYWEHLRFALSFAASLFVAAGAALLHALFPFLCEKTGGDIVRRLYARISNR